MKNNNQFPKQKKKKEQLQKAQRNMQTSYYPMQGINMLMNRPLLQPVTLYVGNLDETVHEEQLFAHFSKYGTLHSIKIVVDKKTRKSKGFAYVNFMFPKDAENARLVAQYDILGKKPIRILYKGNPKQNSSANLFVKNIDPSVNFRELHNHFSRVGTVLTVRIMCNKEGMSLEYGYVQFEKDEDAERAIKELNGSKLKEREIHVEKFQARDARKTMTHSNLYVRHLPEGKTKEEIENTLQELFVQYGKIISLLVMRKEGKPWSALICMESPESAVSAKNALDGHHQIEGAEHPLYVNLHKSRQERALERKLVDDKRNETNMFMKNLKPEVSEAQIRELFQIFGEITNCGFKEKEYQGKTFKMFFANYKYPEDAIKAQSQSAQMEEIRKLFYDDKPYVGLWLSKEQRERFKQTQANRRRRDYPPQGYPQAFPLPGHFMPVQPFRMMHPTQFFQQPSWQGVPRPAFYNTHLLNPQQPHPQTQVHPQGGRPQFSRSRQGPFANQRADRNPRFQGNHRPRTTELVARNQRGTDRNGQNGAGRPQSQLSRETVPAEINREPAVMQQIPVSVQSIKDRMNDFMSIEPEKQRNILGEILFPKVMGMAGSELAPKITGMLVDFDVLTIQDIIELLEDPAILQERIEEARELIQQEKQE